MVGQGTTPGEIMPYRTLVLELLHSVFSNIGVSAAALSEQALRMSKCVTS